MRGAGRITQGVIRTVRVFANAQSGAGQSGCAALVQRFAALGCHATCTPLERSVDLTGLAASDAAETAFIAAGGDGTVNAVAGAVAGSGRPMGVLPLGTLNHFARDLRLPLLLDEAVAAIVAGRTRPVDAAEVRCRSGTRTVFVNNSSLGVYPAMASRRQRLRRGGWNSWTALVVASAKAFVRFRVVELQLDAGQEQRRCTTPFVFIGNNAYCLDGSGSLGERAGVEDGVLSVAVAPGMTRAGSMRFLLRALAGRAGDAPELEQFRVEHARMMVRKRVLRVSVDGEVRRLRPPLEYRILPGALRVLCPEKDAR